MCLGDVRMLAYLDANSGSLIASAIAAGFAGIAVVFKLGWSKTIGLFSPKARRAAKEARAAEAAEAESAPAEAPQASLATHDATEG
jgi:hypothetical protein